MRERETPLRYAVDERPPLAIAAGLGLQNALFVISGAIFLPILMRSLGIVSFDQAAFLVSATLLTAGLSTAVQAIRMGRVGSGYMLFMGTSGAFFAATMDAIELAGIGFVAALALIAAPTEWLIAHFFRVLRTIFTPTVGGVVVMSVAVLVVPIALDQWQGAFVEGKQGSSEFLLIGAVSAIVMISMIVWAPARFRLWSPILGLAAGSLTALATGDWHFTQTSEAAIVGFPIGEWETPTFPLTGEAFAVLGAFVIATLAGTFETVGDAIAVQKVSQRRFHRIDYESVRGALNADAVGNALAGIMCTTPNTTYSSPTGMIPVIGVGSRYVALYGGGLMIVMAFFPVLTGFVLDLPLAAIGAVTFVTMLLLFVMGLQLAVSGGINGRTTLIIGVAFWGGFAAQNGLFFMDKIPDALEPIAGNSISASSVLAVALTALFRLVPRKRLRWRGRADAEELPAVLEFAQQSAQSMRLPLRAANELELCLEEVFTHLSSQGEPDRTLRIELSPDDSTVDVMVTDRSEARDVEMPDLPPDLVEAESEDLRDLGLVLLNQIASHVTHTTISDWQYISFEIPKSSELAPPPATVDV